MAYIGFGNGLPFPLRLGTRGRVPKMTNHPNRRGKFELTFWGAASAPQFPRYRRYHATFASAEQTAAAILNGLDNRAAHPAIIYGPDCGRDGTTVI